MRVFAPGWLSSRDEFISVTGRFPVAVYTISSRDDFIPGKFHPCLKHRDEMSFRDGTWRKMPCKRSSRDENSMRDQCLWYEGLGEMNSTRAGNFRPRIQGGKHSFTTKILSSRDETLLGPLVNGPLDKKRFSTLNKCVQAIILLVGNLVMDSHPGGSSPTFWPHWSNFPRFEDSIEVKCLGYAGGGRESRLELIRFVYHGVIAARLLV